MKNISMNTEITKAILDGRKTQTRRVIPIDTVMYDNPTVLEPDSCVKFNFSAGGCQNYSVPPLFVNSKYQKGDIVWVREPAKILGYSYDMLMLNFKYIADNKIEFIETPDRFLPTPEKNAPKWIYKHQGIPNGCIKEMARIFLKITDVRVERLQDISYEDILKEGFPIDSYEMKNTLKLYSNDTNGEIDFEEDRASEWWKIIWDKTAEKGYKWEDNPYVFVYEFERVNKDWSDYNE
ncbi:MAG: hypothetical protein QM497_09950 [Sulfurimonas sp.]